MCKCRHRCDCVVIEADKVKSKKVCAHRIKTNTLCTKELKLDDKVVPVCSQSSLSLVESTCPVDVDGAATAIFHGK